MSLFTEILLECNLLQEGKYAVTDENIKDAIENCKEVSLMYHGEEKRGGRSWRYIWPVVYGYHTTKEGETHYYVRAFQVGGSTIRGNKKWKLFRKDRIRAWYNQENTETDKTHEFDPQVLIDNIPSLNTEGDNQLTGENGLSGKIIYHCPLINIEENNIDSKPIDVKNINPIKEPNEPSSEEKNNGTSEYTFSVKPNWKEIYNNIVDNSEKNNYLSKETSDDTETREEKGNEIFAPETKPVERKDIQPDDIKPQNNTVPQLNDEPISRDYINGEEDTSEENKEKENDITPVFENLMRRWSKLDR